MNEMELLRALSGVMNNQAGQGDLKKALTTASGFLGINLEPQAKLMLPLFAGLRHRLPADTPNMGAAQAQWRMQLGYGSFAFGAAANFGTANGANGGTTTESALTIAADYKSLSINGGVQWEAIQQAMGWDDAMSIDTMMALSLLMRLEELIVLYGNEAAITMTTVTGNPSDATALNTFSNAVWSVAVTAITGQGTLTNGAANSNVGETTISYSDISVGAGAADYLDVSWPCVPGALGYKVYANHAGAGGHGVGALYLCDPNTTLNYAKLSGGSYLASLGDPIVVPAGQTYVTVNHVQIYAIPANTQPTAPAADASVNANSFEGMHAWMTKSTIYGTALPFRNMVDLAGLPLTAQGTGVAEFDSILKTQWQMNHSSPSLVICSSNGVVSLGNKIAAAGNGSQLRLDVYQNRNNIVGGLYIGGYVNKFASSMAGMQTTIDVWAHPYMPDGTYMFVSENVPPETYPYSRTPKCFGLDVQTPYSYLPLGRTDRSFPYDVFLGETLKCYNPSMQAAIVGARMDS